MENLAPVEHPIHDLLRRRWSPRAFAPRSVEREKLLALFEAARWAPSSYNEQPWAYIVARKEDQENFARLLDCLIEFNQSWAREAPVLAVSVGHMKFSRNNQPNPHGLHDTGAASMALCVEATHLGLVVHQMAGFSGQKARAAFAIPDDWEPAAAMAIGYPGDPEALPEKLREREKEPRTRKPIRDFVFGAGWQSKPEFL